MKIVVLIKQVPDTEEERTLDAVTGGLDRQTGENVVDEVAERALEAALSYKDAHKGTEVVLVSMGPATANQALRKCLSMGADSAVHVLDDTLAGSDIGRTSAVLAAALRHTGFDVIIAGNESTDGRGGVVPAMVAEHLGLPHLSFMNSVEIADDTVVGERAAENGTLRVRASLPAVISVTERSPAARFPNFKGIMTAKRKPLTTLALGDLDMDPAFAGAGRSVVVSTRERPARTAGKKIVDEGNAGVELAEFLVAGRLI
ncbi:electron transfer flavoprotein subunit beta/FixA family protein [Specibacter sp. RAF43]|uniref:electron transfer flavoprotein subunit beta/FixA family protein n=1 Tax=Specibacter sp. RAF43 TaxID=3233057 RepID=UPI003F9A60FF